MFVSSFKNRLVSQITDNNEIDFVEQSIETAMIVISDGSVIRNGVKKPSGSIVPLGLDRYTGQLYGNMNFLLNCIDYLCDDSGLMDVRRKEFRLRILDKNRVLHERLYWQIINVVIPVCLILLFGLIKFFLRRKKYS